MLCVYYCVAVQVKLSDFGLARVLNKGSIYNLTNVETLLPIGW